MQYTARRLSTANTLARDTPVIDGHKATNALDGAILLGGRTSLPDTWRILHSNANIAIEAISARDNSRGIHDMLEKADTALLKSLEECNIEHWAWLCEGAGWTIVGAAALSWCRGVQAAQVWSAWAKSGYPLAPTPHFLRTTRQINPKIILTGSALSELFAKSPNHPTFSK